MSKKVAIFSGTFDPVHVGHLEFAIEAIKQLKLDKVYFLPERLPRTKTPVHFAHRLSMIKLAIQPYPKLDVMELPERQFSVNKTLPEVKNFLGGAELYFMFGSDKVASISSWPNSNSLLNSAQIIICPTRDFSLSDIKRLTHDWPSPPLLLKTMKRGDISSGQVRDSLTGGGKAKGLLKSTEKYIRDNWLYISLDSTS